jgi:hypothetical protein
MSLDHKAFEFDWRAFADEFLSLLTSALERNKPLELRQFVEGNLLVCHSPYDGSSLERDWDRLLENGDAQEFADFALTKYYDPAQDNGLGTSWFELQMHLSASARSALLGRTLPLFDPGRQGSYFQTPEEVAESARVLEPLTDPVIAAYRAFLLRAALSEHGLYVTF